MIQKLNFLLVVLILFSINNSYAVSDTNDSTKTRDTTEINYQMKNFRFVDNLDSLVNLWYIKKAISANHIDTNFSVADTSIIPVFPDSVYISRFAEINSIIDLSFNSRVKSYLNVYTKKKRDKVEIMLGLSDYYFPIFEEVLAYYDLPQELKYLPVIESALNPRAVSRAGATGLWQFMYSTGKMYGLEIGSYIDERRDPIKSSHAAARFLKDLYETFGDWTLVIAAYNCGPGNVNKAIRRSGGKRNYWDIYYRLPRETRGYVPAFIAATYTMNFYKEHNLIPTKLTLPTVNDTICVSEKLHLGQVSEVLNIPIQQLRDLNPHFKKDIIPKNKKKEYYLRLPEQYITSFIDLEDSIFTYKDLVFFNPENISKSPAKYSASNYYAPQPKNSVKLYYRVKPGDNLGYIASWYNVGVSKVRNWNNIYRNLIKVGQKLVIYVPKNKKSKYSNINTMTFEQKQKSIGKKVSVQQINSTEVNYSSKYVYYTVRKGDNLWTIAKKYPGVSNYDIMKLNNISNAKNLVPGQKLKIKVKG